MDEVEAVKSAENIVAMGKLLAVYGSADMQDIWTFGINVALRINDLLGIRYQDIDMERREIQLLESKTGKARTIRLNEKALAIVEQRANRYPNDTFLFQSHGNRGKGGGKPIHRSSVAKVFKEVGESLGIKLGTHSMRKTRGYHLYRSGVSIEQIAKVLNHSSPSVTMVYIGLTKEETLQTYDDFVL